MAFTRAERRKSSIKLAITGPSGSGKTYSALKLAFGLGQRIAVVDTENGSASLYADLGVYDTLEIVPPFTTQKYQDAIALAVKHGYDVLVIDSLSHAWASEGGLLDQKSARDARGGNSFSNWAEITKLQNQLLSDILQSQLHVIATMRSKQDYVLEQDARGKQTPKKVGLAPVQRDGMEYEFTTVFDVAMDHTAIASKDRTGLFDGMVAKLSEEHGRKIAQWLGSAAPAAREPMPLRQAGQIMAGINPNGTFTTPSGATVDRTTDEVLEPSADTTGNKSLKRLKQEDHIRALLNDAGKLGVFDKHPTTQHLIDFNVETATDDELRDVNRELGPVLLHYQEARAATAPATAVAEHPLACAECGAMLTPGRRTLSLQKHGRALCLKHEPAKAAA